MTTHANRMDAARRIVAIAERNCDSSDSAAVCLSDARECIAADDPQYAASRALNSLKHSVGICSLDYCYAWELMVEAGL